ncbi:hypothetical protein RhiJN_11772 [Ceratobasidium sp. AG-Ba]|nr:hypothetical protein RhiJN_11772 [Ceratobasidium sp. AG-Ba]
MDSSPEKRVSKKTIKGADWDAGIAKSRANIEIRARNKNVREEEAALAALEEDEEEQSAEDVVESPAKNAPKRKAPAKKAAAPRPSSPQRTARMKEARNIAQVLADEAMFTQLKYMIFGRDQTPLAELELLDLPELEKRWEEGPPQPLAAPTKGKGKLPDAPPKKKLGPPPTSPSQRHGQGSTFQAVGFQGFSARFSTRCFQQGKGAIVDCRLNPGACKAHSRASADRDAGARRPRLDFTEKPKASRAPAQAVQAPSFDNPAASTTTSRASSRVPSAAPSRSQSSGPSHPVPRGGPDDFDGETFDLDAGHDGADSETEQARTMKPAKQTKQAKPRAKKGDITDPQEKAVVNRTVEETVALLVPDMCASPDETEVKIGKAWAKAVKSLDLPAEQWQMTAHNLAVVKSLVGGILLESSSPFGLALSPELDAEDVKQMAADLLPIEFLRDPKSPDKDSGHYQSSIIARVIAAIWFTSSKPVTSRYPTLLNPVPVDVIAFACALMQDILKRLAKEGFIKVEKRATTDEQKKEKELEKARLKAIAKATGVKPEASKTRAAVDPVRELLSAHYTNLAVFEEVMGPDFDEYRATLYKDACKWAGKQKEFSDDEGETEARRNPGVLTAASFAGDLRKARSRQSVPPVSGSHGGRSTGAAAKKRAPVGMIGKDHHEDTNREPQEEPDREPQELYDADKPGEIGRSAQKRRSRKELTADNQGNRQPGSESDDEQPLKKPRLSNKPTRAVPESDDEQDQRGAEPRQGEVERKPQAREGMQAVEHVSDVAQSQPSTTAVPGMARPSSPLSDSPDSPKAPEAPEAPESPEQSPAPAKRATRQSSRAAKQVPSSEAVMLAAIEKRKQLEAERRERAAQKKKEADEANKADEANWQEMERRAKGLEPEKPKAPGKRKPKKGGN